MPADADERVGERPCNHRRQPRNVVVGERCDDDRGRGGDGRERRELDNDTRVQAIDRAAQLVERERRGGVRGRGTLDCFRGRDLDAHERDERPGVEPERDGTRGGVALDDGLAGAVLDRQVAGALRGGDGGHEREAPPHVLDERRRGGVERRLLRLSEEAAAQSQKPSRAFTFEKPGVEVGGERGARGRQPVRLAIARKARRNTQARRRTFAAVRARRRGGWCVAAGTARLERRELERVGDDRVRLGAREQRRQARVVVDREDARVWEARPRDLLEMAAAVHGNRAFGAVEDVGVRPAASAHTGMLPRGDDEDGLGARDRRRHQASDESVRAHGDTAHHDVEVTLREARGELGPAKRDEDEVVAAVGGVGAGDLDVEAGERAVRGGSPRPTERGGRGGEREGCVVAARADAQRRRPSGRRRRAGRARPRRRAAGEQRECDRRREVRSLTARGDGR